MNIPQQTNNNYKFKFYFIMNCRKISFPSVTTYGYVRTSPCAKVKKVKLLKVDTDLKAALCASKRSLRNPVDGSFAVLLDENNVYLKEMVKLAQKNGLTVSGDSSACVSGGDIKAAGLGDIVTFGTSTRFDMNWISRKRYACERSIMPIHRASDWSIVKKAIKALAKEKNTLEATRSYVGNYPTYKSLKASARKSSCGCTKGRTIIKIEDRCGTNGYLHNDFVKVGLSFYPVVKRTNCNNGHYLVRI